MSLYFLTFLFLLASTGGLILDGSTPTTSQGNETCSDSGDINCESADVFFNACSDTHHAKVTCRKYCNLCDLVDGNWTDWTEWSTCDVSCGTGNRTRTRSCTNPAPANLGLNCTGPSSENKTCTLDPCPVHGGWSAWGTWGTCSVSCDVGIQRRDRTCTNPQPQYFGDHCFGDSFDNRLCFPGSCEDGGWSVWTSWGSCSKSCGAGIMTRERYCDNPAPSMLGSYCRGSISQTDTCGSGATDACTVRGGWSTWTSWSSCSKSYGAGIMTRERYCDNPAPSTLGSYCRGPSSQSDTCGSCATSACIVLPNVAFLVKYPRSTLTDLRPIFTDVIQNEGGSYNVTSGIFTCTVSGLYQFAFNFMSDSDDHSPYCTFYHNNSHLVYTQAKGKYDSGTMMIYLNLSIGETIDVRCYDWTDIYHGGTTMWFTGSLIRT